jgi:hypothetical protein
MCLAGFLRDYRREARASVLSDISPAGGEITRVKWGCQ